ncbi:MAG TPA: hypothetical protein VN493_26550 [Thermoanaerobaculia bacterium]|nr:hypothetical protein [Thermoanaerobaculia bacterium]
MKQKLLVAVVLALGFVGPAFAADYFANCTEPACYPFNATNSYVLQKAVNLAYSSNAAVGDNIFLVDPTGTRICEQKDIWWVVNQVPTLNSTHLTLIGLYCTTRGNQ